MAILTFPETFSFPSQEVMSKYLKNHPLIEDDDELKENSVVEKIAQVFANTTKALKEVQTGIARILKSSGLGDPVDILKLGNIQEAVQDCASGKIFSS